MKPFEPTPDQKRMLEEVATGDLGAIDESVLAEARREPAFCQALQEIQALREALRAAATEQDEDRALASVGSEPFEGADQLVRDAAKRRRFRIARRRAAIAILLAASVLALAGIWWLPREEPLRRGELLGTRVECLAPCGSVPEFHAFAWRSALPDRGYFVVTVYESELRRVVLAESPRLQVQTWAPTVALPREIYWEIRVYDVGGETLEWGAARAERR